MDGLTVEEEEEEEESSNGRLTLRTATSVDRVFALIMVVGKGVYHVCVCVCVSVVTGDLLEYRRTAKVVFAFSHTPKRQPEEIIFFSCLKKICIYIPNKEWG